ncbi:MAG: aminoglycoside N(3)-acetyltransferase [Halobacteriota archaeon]
MTEVEAIERTDEPVTVERLVDDLRRLGIESDDTLLVHTAMHRLGWVCGGAPAVVDALMEVLAGGTLVMPTFTTQYTDPRAWSNPPVPTEWVPTIVERRPPYRPAITPTRMMGAVAECFRTYPQVVRSEHPIYSFAAWGDGAAELVADHGLPDGLGDNSPLATVYERDGSILMLGTDYETNTSLHLAEYRAGIDLDRLVTRVPVIRDGERVMVDVSELDVRTDDFDSVGVAFEAEQTVPTGEIGVATARLIDHADLVDFASTWFEANR